MGGIRKPPGPIKQALMHLGSLLWGGHFPHDACVFGNVNDGQKYGQTNFGQTKMCR